CYNSPFASAYRPSFPTRRSFRSLISEKNFLRLFPDVEGYRFFLLNVPPARAYELTGVLEAALADYGFQIQHSRQLVRSRWRDVRSEEHTSELQSPDQLVCRLLLE